MRIQLIASNHQKKKSFDQERTQNRKMVRLRLNPDRLYYSALTQKHRCPPKVANVLCYRDPKGFDGP